MGKPLQEHPNGFRHLFSHARIRDLRNVQSHIDSFGREIVNTAPLILKIFQR
jgi:hypothetical protein